MATYAELYSLVHSGGPLWQRAEMACFDVARDIKAEDAGTSNHTNRIIWANACLTSPAVKLQEMKLAILECSGIFEAGDAVTDPQLKAAVASLVDTYATGE